MYGDLDLMLCLIRAHEACFSFAGELAGWAACVLIDGGFIITVNRAVMLFN